MLLFFAFTAVFVWVCVCVLYTFLLRNSDFGEPLDVLLLLQMFHWKENLFLKFSTECWCGGGGKEKKRKNATIWKMEKYEHILPWKYCCRRTKLQLLCALGSYSLLLICLFNLFDGIWCGFFCCSFFLCHMRLKNKLSFSLSLSHSFPLVFFFPEFVKWYFWNEKFGISWAKAYKVKQRVHIAHFTISMWLNLCWQFVFLFFRKKHFNLVHSRSATVSVLYVLHWIFCAKHINFDSQCCP